MKCMSNANVLEILKEIEKMFPNAGCELNYQNIFQLIIAVSLSAQTTDKSVNLVTPVLFEKYPTCYELAKADAVSYTHLCCKCLKRRCKSSI